MSDKLLEPVCKTNPIVFLDINIGQEYAGRVIIELRADVVPKTAENFRALCTGECGMGKLGKPLHYKGTRFHKVRRIFVVQSGDIVNNDGTSGESIYGPIFEDENFELTHQEGVVSMANYGSPNTNNSQFVVTIVACDNLNGTNVVVGRVLRGLSIINEMEQYTSDEGGPTEEIIIRDCGQIPPEADWGIADRDETADKLPAFPQDWDKKESEFTIDEIMEILTCIRNAGNHFFTKESYVEARRKYRKANRYYYSLRKRFEYQELKEPDDITDDAELRQIDAFAVLNNNNIAAVELKLSEYQSAIAACTEALRLDADCSKAYYRRGQAQLEIANYEDAIKDLKQAHDLMPDNKQILAELNRAKKLLSGYTRTQMNALKNLFN